MKRITTTILPIMLLLLFSGCSGDDDGTSRLELTNENVAGEYRVVAYNEVIVERAERPLDPGTFDERVTEIVGRDFNQQSNIPTFTFNTDGSLSASGGFITEQITSDPPIVDAQNLGDFGFEGYSLDDSDYTITLNAEVAGVQSSTLYSVEKFDEDELDIEFNDVEMVNDIEFTYTTSYELERIEE